MLVNFGPGPITLNGLPICRDLRANILPDKRQARIKAMMILDNGSEQQLDIVVSSWSEWKVSDLNRVQMSSHGSELTSGTSWTADVKIKLSTRTVTGTITFGGRKYTLATPEDIAEVATEIAGFISAANKKV